MILRDALRPSEIAFVPFRAKRLARARARARFPVEITFFVEQSRAVVLRVAAAGYTRGALGKKRVTMPALCTRTDSRIVDLAGMVRNGRVSLSRDGGGESSERDPCNLRDGENP